MIKFVVIITTLIVIGVGLTLFFGPIGMMVTFLFGRSWLREEFRGPKTYVYHLRGYQRPVSRRRSFSGWRLPAYVARLVHAKSTKA